MKELKPTDVAMLLAAQELEKDGVVKIVRDEDGNVKGIEILDLQKLEAYVAKIDPE